MPWNPVRFLRTERTASPALAAAGSPYLVPSAPLAPCLSSRPGGNQQGGLGPHGGKQGCPHCHSVSSRPGRIRVAAGSLVLLAVLWPVLGGDPARAAAGSDRLLPGETLQAGQWISAGRDTLAMQGDGNLVLGVRATSRAGTAARARPGPSGRPARTTGRC